MINFAIKCKNITSLKPHFFSKPQAREKLVKLLYSVLQIGKQETATSYNETPILLKAENT